jgi:HlyD family secretion protein
MDVVRPAASRKKLVRRSIIGGVVLAIALTTLGLAKLKPSAPEVDRNTLVIDSVKRGPMTREVRGTGVLTPEDIRWISTATDARVERVVVQPGAVVRADTVVVELSNDQQQQAANDAEWQLRAAQADDEPVRAQLAAGRLDREAGLARLRAEAKQAALHADADAELERQGLAAHITREISRTSAEETQSRMQIEEERLRVSAGAQDSRLAAAKALVEQRRALRDLQKERVAALSVRAGIDGVLQQVSVQAGQRVAAGTTIARIARPDRLKAEIRIAETQAKDIVVGQRAKLDTRNGLADAHVARIDPAVREGTVTIDLAIDGALPPGARPDLSVDATIELERIADTLAVARPSSAPENGTGAIFRLSPDGTTAVRTSVTFGRASASSIEIRRGLAPGDSVIVSDATALYQYDRIRIR